MLLPMSSPGPVTGIVSLPMLSLGPASGIVSLPMLSPGPASGIEVPAPYSLPAAADESMAAARARVVEIDLVPCECLNIFIPLPLCLPHFPWPCVHPPYGLGSRHPVFVHQSSISFS